MKIVCIFFIILLINLSSAITGEVTKEEITLNITISNPILFDIINPENGTYITNQLDISYNIGNANKIYYQINNSTKILLLQNITINLTNGNYNILFYATKDTQTKIIKRNISIDNKKFNIIYDKYKYFNKTTKFEQIPFEKFYDIYNATLESEFGRIEFLEKIELPEDLIYNDNILNIDANSYIIDKEIFLNKTILKNLNKKSKIYFYNITYNNPMILRDNIECSDCKLISYENKILEYEIPHFSKYTIIERQINSNNPSRNSNYKKDELKKNNFTLNETRIYIKTTNNQIIKKIITIKNNDNKELTLNLNLENQTNLISFSNQIILSPNQEIQLEIIINTSNQFQENSYLNKIKINSENEEKELLIIIDINSQNKLFDIKLDILNQNKIYEQDKLRIKTEIINIGNSKEITIPIIYEIKDINNQIIFTKEKNISITERKTIFENFYIPKYTKPGEYIITTKILYDGKIALSSAHFTIRKKNITLLLISIFILAMIIILIRIKIHKSKESKSHGK